MKKDLSERDIITKFIFPAVEKSGWDKLTQIREEVAFTDGRIFVKGRRTRRGERKRADIILYYRPNIPVAVIEAKDNNHSVGAGLQQALGYAETLDVPVAISSNGDGFAIQYRKNCGSANFPATREIGLDGFPSPDELWDCYKRYNGLDGESSEKAALSQYFLGADCHSPRYYQRIAINRTVEAIARGQKRILLVMATGTGKTFTAFQIIYKLWKSGAKKRILYLADRNNLIVQTKKGDFKHFKDKPTIIRNKKIDKSYEIYLALHIDPTSGREIVFAEYCIDSDFGNAKVAERTEKRGKVRIAGVDVRILSERKQFLDADGRLVTASFREYTKNGILTSYRSLDAFLQVWNDAEKKRIIISELENQGIIFEELKEEIKSDLDIFDLICHIAWDAPALTRRERAENVKKRNYWTKYGERARAVLAALLEKYAQAGIEEIEDMKILTVNPLKEMGTPAEIVRLFGGKAQYLQALRELEAEIYRAA